MICSHHRRTIIDRSQRSPQFLLKGNLMIRKTLFALSLAAASTVGFVGAASAQAAPSTTNPLKCVGAVEHKQAQSFRLQAAQSELKALQARRAVAVSANKAEAVTRIDARIAKVNAHIAKIQANQAKFAARCP
jgi:hypothetical protein